MRTTIRLDNDLLKVLKRLAAETHRTLTAVIQDALREALARREKRPARGRVQLPTFAGHGLQAGTDLDNTAALTDLMEGH